jgi:hypothetical protein
MASSHHEIDVPERQQQQRKSDRLWDWLTPEAYCLVAADDPRAEIRAFND